MKKHSYEFIRSEFAKEGYKLLFTEYVNSKEKLDYICPNGHKHSISWSEWSYLGNRCPYCSGKIKKTIKFIKNEFKKEGYVLLTMAYKNAFQKLDYICPNGHRHNITWNNWYIGHRCPYCAGQIKPDIEFIKKKFAEEGYQLLTKKYIDNKQKLECICPFGHDYSVSWNKWLMGRRCWVCSYIKRSGENHPNWLGGISCESYCDVWLDKDFKESIKERDNYQCQNPGCWGTSKRLTIHHIDYIKKNCHPENLITLCNSCNSRANRNRGRHQNFYNKIMGEKEL